MKIVKKYQVKIVIFTAVKNRCILHRHVFVMMIKIKTTEEFKDPLAQVVERPLREWEVAGLILSCAIPKALEMAPVATLLRAQLYKASTGFSGLTHKYRTTNIAQ